MLNLQAVLDNAVGQDPQVWVGRFVDRSGSFLEMESGVPPSGEEVLWMEKLREFDQFQQAILDGAQVGANLPIR
jgi:hypothetical protein